MSAPQLMLFQDICCNSWKCFIRAQCPKLTFTKLQLNFETTIQQNITNSTIILFSWWGLKDNQVVIFI